MHDIWNYISISVLWSFPSFFLLMTVWFKFLFFHLFLTLIALWVTPKLKLTFNTGCRLKKCWFTSRRSNWRIEFLSLLDLLSFQRTFLRNFFERFFRINQGAKKNPSNWLIIKRTDSWVTELNCWCFYHEEIFNYYEEYGNVQLINKNWIISSVTMFL